MHINIDLETYSSVDLKSCGVYKYVDSTDFEVLLMAYSINGGEVEIVDFAKGETIPSNVHKILLNKSWVKKAHNANFERLCLSKIGYTIEPIEWECSAVKASYCGLPSSLEDLSKALNLKSFSKSATGKNLIKYFCCPVKGTKVNGGRTRNFHYHDENKWEDFKEYCKQDVIAEQKIEEILNDYKIPISERILYALDQKINDTGVEIDLNFVKCAVEIDRVFSIEINKKVIDLTGIANPNSPDQLKKWLSNLMQKEIKTLAKEVIPTLLEESGSEAVSEVLRLRTQIAKSSIKKYTAMLKCVGADKRARGLFQFYGANRTGRWAGRLIQLQNLPRNTIKDLDVARQIVLYKDFELMDMCYDNVPSTISQLIRTSFIPKEGHSLVVSDFSAIEARVIAWFSDEKWRLDVFNSHGKIYEASASMMFNVPLESVTKGSSLRDKGKIAELALGYQGSLGALKQMGGESMGLSDSEMERIVTAWRKANSNIVNFWKKVESAAISSVKGKKETKVGDKLTFNCDGEFLMIKLPSGRELFYREPKLSINRFGNASIVYKGMDQKTKQWGIVDTYGGKLVENIVQATARDILAMALIQIDRCQDVTIIMHVHDEVVCETPIAKAKDTLELINSIMSQEIEWAKGLPLGADGYITNYYKKD